YCSGKQSTERRSAQTALFHLLDSLVRMYAPLIPYTADEVYAYVPGKRSESVHVLELHQQRPGWSQAELETPWSELLNGGDEALKLLEARGKAGTISAPLEAVVSLGAIGANSHGETLKQYRDRLKELFIVSGVDLLDSDEIEHLRTQAGGREEFAVDGTFV